MSAIKLLVLAVLLATSFICMGCMGGGKDKSGNTASRGRFGMKKKQQKKDTASRDQKRGNPDLEDLSPEGSMQRDLKRLQEKEKAQAKLVNDMRSNLAQRGGDVKREEDKLQDIREKINRYDSAMQRYEMASRARPQREYEGAPAVIPASQFEDRPVRSSRAVYDGDGEDNLRAAGYGDQRPRGRTAGRNRAIDNKPRNAIAREGETVLYDPNAYASAPQTQAPVPQYQPSQYQAPQQQQQYQGGEQYPNPFAPPQARQPEPQRSALPAMGPSQDDGWAPRNTLFSDAPRTPQRRPGRVEKEFPAVPTLNRQPEPLSSMSAPAPLPQTTAPVSAPSAVAAPAKQLPQVAAEDEEVFTPDLFLSGGR